MHREDPTPEPRAGRRPRRLALAARLRAGSGERVRPSGAQLPVMRCGSPAGPCPRPVCILCRTFGPATGQAFVAGGVFPGSTEAPTRAELVCLLRGGPRPPRACGGRAGGLGAAR